MIYSTGRLTTCILSWFVAKHVSQLGQSTKPYKNILFMRAMFAVHATYFAVTQSLLVSPPASLQNILFPPLATAASVAICLVAKLSCFSTLTSIRASYVLLWIIKLATPGLLWTAVAESNDPIAESDPCALASVTLAVALGGPTNSTAAGVILLMLTGGEALEDYALARAGDGLRRLIELFRLEGTVRRINLDKNINDHTLVDVQRVVQGDIIQLAEGDTIPTDGFIVSNPTLQNGSTGNSGSVVMVDESAISGEAGAVPKNKGMLVYSGTVVCRGTCTLLVQRTAEKSMGGLMRRELSEALADRRQAPMERSCVDLARALTPIAFTVAFVSYALRARYASSSSSTAALRNWEVVLSVLMAATPCPLSIGVPVAFLSARSTITQEGITLKSGGALERLARVTTVVLDKTGTLTTGKMTIVEACWLRKVSTTTTSKEWRPVKNHEVCKAALACVAAVERHSGSRHAVALAFVRSHQQQTHVRGASQEEEVVKVVTTISHPGRGVMGVVSLAASNVLLPASSLRIVSGSKEYVVEQVASFCGANALINHLEFSFSTTTTNGRFQMFVALISVNDERKHPNNQSVLLCGSLYFEDPLRSSAVSFVSSLKNKYGLRVILTSGDRSPALEDVARKVNLPTNGVDWHHCLPSEKVALVKHLKSTGERVLMVGDGMNDAAALAAADVAIAVGANDLVASVSDIIMHSHRKELEKVLGLLDISKQTLRIARRGVVCGMTMSTLQMVCAATGLVPPVVNAVLQELVDLSTVIHAMVSPSSFQIPS